MLVFALTTVIFVVASAIASYRIHAGPLEILLLGAMGAFSPAGLVISMTVLYAQKKPHSGRENYIFLCMMILMIVNLVSFGFGV